jgi:hypothetical protein
VHFYIDCSDWEFCWIAQGGTEYLVQMHGKSKKLFQTIEDEERRRRGGIGLNSTNNIPSSHLTCSRNPTRRGRNDLLIFLRPKLADRHNSFIPYTPTIAGEWPRKNCRLLADRS